ncbi:MAG: DM13 domain-containing protein [Solirubrobacteraceae bacterium]
MRRFGCAALALIALGGCGGGDDGVRTTADPFTEVSREPSLTRTARRAAPRWERVARLQGIAAAVHQVSIARGAIQWRARWRCSRGRLAMTVEPKPRSESERSGGRCPGSGEATWVQTGSQRLRVAAGGRWSVVVEQQVDTPIDEPPLAAMKAPGARLVASGSFYRVERQGSGRARLYRLADGRGALRLDPFRTSANTDLYVWLSSAARPRTTKQTVRARRVGRLIALKSTIGPQNYVLPAGVDPSDVRSIAIWCAPIQIVYTAAGLGS